jgi:hypothetical protein
MDAAPLRDYIFVDHARLDSYVEQIASPSTYDKVPVWSWGLSLTGPKVEGKEDRKERERTTSEKINLLLNHLEKIGHLAQGRIQGPTYFDHTYSFRIETCQVVTVQIRSSSLKQSEAADLVLWVSEALYKDPFHFSMNKESPEPHRLFLLKGTSKNDDTTYSAKSAYSTLLQLYEEGVSLSREFDETFMSDLRAKKLKEVLRKRKLKTFTPRRSSVIGTFGEDDPEQMEQEVDEQLRADPSIVNPHDEELKREFATNPLGAFRRMGASLGDLRVVEALYRVRAAYMETQLPDRPPAIITFGYPIFVSVAGTPL